MEDVLVPPHASVRRPGAYVAPPPSGGGVAQPAYKNAVSGIAAVDELPLIAQDQWGTDYEPTAGKQGTRTNAPAIDRAWLQGTGGATSDNFVGYFRSYWDAGGASAGVVPPRMSFVDWQGRRAIRDHWPAGVTTAGNLMQHLRNNILEGGNVYLSAAVGIDVWVPLQIRMWDLQQQRPDNEADGKTPFGLTVAMRDYEIQGGIGDNEAKTNANPVTTQSGCSCGVNWDWIKNAGTTANSGWGRIRVRTFIHHIGVGTALRDGGTGNYGELMSNAHELVPNFWNRLFMRVDIDPSARSRDRVRFWVNSTAVADHNNIDLGGWQGNRGISGTGRIAGANGGGWGVAGMTSHSMIGGPTPMQLTTESDFYWSNWFIRVGARKP